MSKSVLETELQGSQVNWRRCLVFFVAFLCGNLSAQPPSPQYRGIPPSPKHEVRAIWLTTVGALDWPKSLDREEQQRSLRDIVRQAKAAKFNTIFFQVRGRADAIYKSQFEPWAQQLTGQWGKDPGWDPLQFVLAEAHAEGLEVHAWFNTFLVKTGGPPPDTQPKHIVLSHPDWVKRVNDEWWLDPGLPQVRAYVTKVALDIVRSYQIDGIHFDFIRYPGPSYPDDATYRRYGDGLTRDQWRRANINTFVRAIYDSVRSIKPPVKVGSTPMGIYTNVPNGSGMESFHSVFQDSRSWTRERKHDYLVPQVYWALGNTPGSPDFDAVVRDWADNMNARHVYIGIAAYKPDVFRQLPELIDASRRAGVHGNAFFRLEHIGQWWRVGERYALHAIVPPMPWKDHIPPLGPAQLSIEELGGDKFFLKWKPPGPARDGEFPSKHVIYRSGAHPVDIDDPANIIAIISGRDSSYIDQAKHPTSPRYYYAVTALDKMNNESEPTNEAPAIVAEFQKLIKRSMPNTVLSDRIIVTASSVAMIPLELGEWTSIDLRILDSSGSFLRSIVDEIRGPGKYVEAVDISGWNTGLYLVELNAGRLMFTRPLRIEEQSGRFSR
jgi:uncharacterized lipoprotein YddW (UPF0748 family)